MDLVILFLLVIAAVATYSLFKNRPRTGDTESISEPPAPPQVTPTIIMHDIILGEAAYFDLEVPEVFATIIEVDSKNVTFMLPDASITSLPIDQFLVRYAPRTQTKICKER